MKAGDVVFFKKARSSAGRAAVENIFKHGYGFGVLLGHVPPFKADPKPVDVFRLLAQLGFCSFDDILEFLGQEACDEVLKKFESKYYAGALPSAIGVSDGNKTAEAPPVLSIAGPPTGVQSLVEIEPRPPLVLVTPAGKPIES